MENTLVDKHVKEKRFLLIFLAIPCLLINQSMNGDAWFLLNHGRYVLENGIPLIEPFTMHSGMTFVMQQWLTSVIFWLLYSNFGAIGLYALILAVFGGIITVTYKLCMRITGGNFIISYGAALCVSIFISFFMVQRPYIFSALFVVLEIYLLEAYIATGKKKCLVLLPILSVLQINLHASMWLFLFVVMLPYAIDAFGFQLLFIKGQGYIKKWFFICAAVMLLVGFINPYGLDAMTYLFRSYGYSVINSTVNEMMPPDINGVFGKVVYGGILGIILIYLLYRKGTSRLRYALLTLGMGYLALSSNRNLLFFAICGVFPLSYYLRNVKLKETTIETTKRDVALRTILTLLICASVVFGIVGRYQTAYVDSHGPEEAGAVAYLKQHADSSTAVLYTDYNTGAYAEFMGFRPYIDARAEVFIKANNNKEDIFMEFAELRDGEIYYKDFLDKYHFTHLLVSKTDILQTYLPHDTEYTMVYEDENYSVYENLR